MQIRNPFHPHSPYEAVELGRRSRLVVGVCDATALFTIPLIVIVTLMLPPLRSVPATLVMILCVGLLPVAVIIRRLVIRHGPDPAASLFLAYLLLVITMGGVTIKGMLPIIVPGYILVILIAGMMLPPLRTSLVTAVAVCSYSGAALIASTRAVEVDFPTSLAFAAVTIITLLSFGFVTLIDRLTNQDLRKALDQATRNLVEANVQLKRASEMKSQFTARTSHELRTPLSSMIVFTDLVLREAYGPINAQLRKALTHVLTSVRHLRRIIDDILDLSKIEAGQLEIADHSFPLLGLVEAVNSAGYGAAEDKGLRFSVSISPDMPPYLLGDEGRLIQVLVNLTGNAVKFTEKGSVDVRIEKHGTERFRVAVQDTGPGIPQDQLEAIFQAYRQLDVSAPKIKGTGLGLAITRHLASMMGGTIHVESELGKGSTFTVELPLRVGQAGEAQPEPAVAA